MRRLNSLCVVITRKSKSKYLDIDMYYISTIVYYIIRDTIVDIYISKFGVEREIEREIEEEEIEIVDID